MEGGAIEKKKALDIKQAEVSVKKVFLQDYISFEIFKVLFD
jgi:hypothetical protein